MGEIGALFAKISTLSADFLIERSGVSHPSAQSSAILVPHHVEYFEADRSREMREGGIGELGVAVLNR